MTRASWSADLMYLPVSQPLNKELVMKAKGHVTLSIGRVNDWNRKRKLFALRSLCVVKSADLRLLVLFHSWAPGCAPLDPLACCYHQGALSMRVSRKGQVVSGLEADWLELTAAYYRKGWSLVDSFVYWDTPKGNLFGPSHEIWAVGEVLYYNVVNERHFPSVLKKS